MGTGSKVFSVFLRCGELCCAVICAGLLGRFFYWYNWMGVGHLEGRLIYAQVIACLEIIFAIFLLPPAKYSFYAWPLDIVWFICSIVAFALLADLSSGCSSVWYRTYWGWYWNVGWACSSWRVILAFMFCGAMCWFLSAILGIFVFTEMRAGRETHHTTVMKEKVMRKKHTAPIASDPEIPV